MQALSPGHSSARHFGQVPCSAEAGAVTAGAGAAGSWGETGAAGGDGLAGACAPQIVQNLVSAARGLPHFAHTAGAAL
jgi:hypothetical protein